MDANHEPVSAADDAAPTFPRTRADALAAWDRFVPHVPDYADGRAYVRAGHRAVSRLSPAIRHRLVTEHELVAATLAAHPFHRAEKFAQELLWRRYWKSWLELRPGVWTDYRADAQRLRDDLGGYQARRLAEVEAGRGGVAVMDHFARELVETGYLHNHARMWFAGWWVHTERLPWQLGADFFYRHLLDADPASNTLSWRWVAGIQTRGKPYLTCRSNVQKYAPELVAAYPDGLDRLGDATAEPVPADDVADPPPAVVPADADDTDVSPDGRPVGLWLHVDDLSPETAAGLAGVRFAGVFAGLDQAVLAAYGVSELRRAYLGDALSDGAARAAAHFGCPVATPPPGGLATAVVDWARSLDLGTVVALRPSVGPVLELAGTVRAALAAARVDLRLVWRAEDVETLPWARSGYFRFWQSAKANLTGRRGGPRRL